VYGNIFVKVKLHKYLSERMYNGKIKVQFLQYISHWVMIW